MRLIGTNPFVAGWGALRVKGEMSPVLQQVQIPVHNNYVCEEAFIRVKKLDWDDQFTEKVICAGDLAGGKDSCHGDSGGPLMLPVHQDGKFPYYEIGIVSYGIKCGRPQLPAVYTNVAHFADWIQDAINEKYFLRPINRFKP